MKKGSEKGITLIALIITIILLLILASVVLNMTLGENGLFKVAKKAGEDYKIASIKERVEQEILVLQTEKITNGEKLTVEETLERLEKNGTFSETDPEEGEGVIDGYIIKIGYDESGNAYIEEINSDKKTRLAITKDPAGYTNGSVKIGIGVKGSDKKIASVEYPEGMTKRDDGLYEVEKNGKYHIKATLEDGEIIEKDIKINTMDKRAPKAFEITARLKDGKLEILGETQDEDANDENACSGIERYEYYVNDTKYDKQPIEGLEGDNYSVYVVAYDKAGNHTSSPVKQVGVVFLYNGENKLPTSVWNFVNATYLPWEIKNGTLGASTIRNGLIEGVELSDLGTATTIQSYDLSQYESLTFTISSYQNKKKIVLGIKNEEGEWIEQRTPEANGDLVIDLSNLNGKGKICIEVDHSQMYMSKIYLK